MHPALSVIFFTVSSGIGYGFFLVLAVFGMFFSLPENFLLHGSGAAIVLVTAGLLSSTFHLANKKNAWRAFFRFKTSWLSREGVLAVLFYPVALSYVALGLAGHNAYGDFWWFLVSGLVIVFALAIIFSTGMIYACLKTIRQWSTPLTPVNYLLLALMHGQLLFVAVQAWVFGALEMQSVVFCQVLLAAGLIMKAVYYAWITAPSGSTISTATGFTGATVRLLDVGHTAGNFLTEEFGYQLPARRRTLLRILVLVLGFIIPAVIFNGWLEGYYGSGGAVAALLFSVAGILIERWLFFAEARHVVNLYHGAPRT